MWLFNFFLLIWIVCFYGKIKLTYLLGLASFQYIKPYFTAQLLKEKINFELRIHWRLSMILKTSNKSVWSKVFRKKDFFTQICCQVSDFHIATRKLKIQWYLWELELPKNWPGDKLFKLINQSFEYVYESKF